MRRTKLQMTAAALLAAMFLGGCGDTAYELTEAEEELIVKYSAHVVTKYNAYQKEGLSYVWPEEETEEAAAEQTQTSVAEEHSVEDDSSLVSSGVSTSEGVDTVSTLPTATLNDLFGEQGVQIEYIGARLAGSYVQDSYYALYPKTGKQYMVVGIDLVNESKVPVEINNLEKTPSFEVKVNGTTTAEAELTFLMEDFTTFETILAPGETYETVLLFQVPDTLTSIDQISLFANVGENYQIILENE